VMTIIFVSACYRTMNFALRSYIYRYIRFTNLEWHQSCYWFDSSLSNISGSYYLFHICSIYK